MVQSDMVSVQVRHGVCSPQTGLGTRGQKTIRGGNMSMEHRCGSRQATNVAVIITTSSGLIGTGVLRQMSASGALIHSSLRMRPDSIVHVRFSLDARRNGRRRCALAGEVVRCTAEGFAVEWLKFEADVARALLESSPQDIPAAPRSAETTFLVNAWASNGARSLSSVLSKKQ